MNQEGYKRTAADIIFNTWGVLNTCTLVRVAVNAMEDESRDDTTSQDNN